MQDACHMNPIHHKAIGATRPTLRLACDASLRIAAPMLHLHTRAGATSVAFRSAPSFENNDLTHAPLSVEAS